MYHNKYLRGRGGLNLKMRRVALAAILSKMGCGGGDGAKGGRVVCAEGIQNVEPKSVIRQFAAREGVPDSGRKSSRLY